MSKYETRTISYALHDIDARLSALEARRHDVALLAQAHNDLAKRAARALGDPRVCVSSDDKPAPTAPATREPGLYVVQMTNELFAIRMWTQTGRWLNQSGYKTNDNGEYLWIGPRIEDPKP